MNTIKYKPYSLELKEPFGTAHGTRTHTDGMLVAVTKDGLTGFGEAFMPPYYDENQASMAAFFEKVDAEKLLQTNDLDSALDFLADIDTGNTAAKAAVDIALHDFFGKHEGVSVREKYQMKGQGTRDAGPKRSDDIAETTLNNDEPGTLNAEPETRNSVLTSFTIGIDTIETMVRKAKAASEFQILKIKLNGQNDIEVVKAIREIGKQDLYVDANQAWDDIEKAKETADELVGLGVGLIEQPFRKGEIEKSKALMQTCEVPVIADEEVQGFEDIKRLAGSFDGINIKLVKCGGIREGFRMIAEARKFGLKVLLGCMTESSLGISAAAAIAPFADWCDLDGNLLIKNDTCTATQTIEGELRLSNAPGIGITDDSKLRALFGLDK